MITEKPNWIRHEGLQIFSIDIQPGGLRFATGGGDQKVRIWNMKSVSKDAENDDSSQRLLATIRDHFGSVNCVRWAKHGRYLASGSDDQVILIHERKAGSGTSEFGSGEPPDVENWKVILTLRGHTADVVDLNWSPDDSTLASGSLDNTVHIWSVTNGICTAVLRGHSSLVKGVTWDPIGSFIASQSDDKAVIIWRTSDWSLAHKTEGHWAKSLGSTFFRRLAWSPCGHFITTTHGFQKPRHQPLCLNEASGLQLLTFWGIMPLLWWLSSITRCSVSISLLVKTQRLHQLDGPMEHQRHQQKNSNRIMLLLLEVKIELLLFGRQQVPDHCLLLSIFSVKAWLIFHGALMVIHFSPALWMVQLQHFTLK